MFYLSLLKESLFPRRAPAQGPVSPDISVSSAADSSITPRDAEAGNAHLDDFVDGVEWERLLVDLACFTEMSDFSAPPRL